MALITAKKTLAQGKFQCLEEYQYIQNGARGTCEVCPGVDTRGVRIIPHIETKDSTHKFVVIANYRIPLEKYVLEFPAGGPDGTETDLQCALRELKEETGYTGECRSNGLGESGVNYLSDPWKSNDHAVALVLDVEEGARGRQELDEHENIRIHCIRGGNMMDDVKRLVDKYGYLVDGQLWSFVIGWTLSDIY